VLLVAAEPKNRQQHDHRENVKINNENHQQRLKQLLIIKTPVTVFASEELLCWEALAEVGSIKGGTKNATQNPPPQYQNKTINCQHIPTYLRK
jgi:hypothetical protein